MRARFLRWDERVFAKKIFWQTIPFDDILVTDLLGVGSEPFTAVSGHSNAPLPFMVPAPHAIFALNLGRQGFENCIAPGVTAAYARELARVWQGPACVARSRQGGRVEYRVGEPWGTYDVDQKASLVEDWVRGGMRIDDPRMTYINAHIRRGNRV